MQEATNAQQLVTEVRFRGLISQCRGETTPQPNPKAHASASLLVDPEINDENTKSPYNVPGMCVEWRWMGCRSIAIQY
eukprot:3935814-Rhodomonas_salina.4